MDVISNDRRIPRGWSLASEILDRVPTQGCSRHLKLMVLVGLWENLQVALRHEPKFSGYWLIVVGITSSFSLSIVWIDF